MHYRTAVIYGGDEQLSASLGFALAQDSLDVSLSRK